MNNFEHVPFKELYDDFVCPHMIRKVSQERVKARLIDLYEDGFIIFNEGINVSTQIKAKTCIEPTEALEAQLARYLDRFFQNNPLSLSRKRAESLKTREGRTEAIKMLFNFLTTDITHGWNELISGLANVSGSKFQRSAPSIIAKLKNNPDNWVVFHVLLKAALDDKFTEGGGLTRNKLFRNIQKHTLVTQDHFDDCVTLFKDSAQIIVEEKYKANLQLRLRMEYKDASITYLGDIADARTQLLTALQ